MQREEFFGASPALARAVDKQQSAWLWAGFGALCIILVVTLMANADDGPINSTSAATALAVFGMGLWYGITKPIAALKHGRDVARLRASPPAEVVWYTLDDTGLTICTGVNESFPVEGLAIPWSAMDALVLVTGAQPHLQLSYHLAAATAPAKAMLRPDYRAADGALFGDRMRTQFDTRAAGIPTPAAVEA